jgi:two-component system catabolic regulation response regulator CreB/two-component system response regulator ChvI
LLGSNFVPPSDFSEEDRNKTSDITASEERTTRGSRQKEPLHLKRILVVDDNADIAIRLKEGLEMYNRYHHYHDNDDQIKFEAYVYNHPLLALSQFKPNFYDLALINTNMPKLNGFQLCENIMQLDVDAKVCFMYTAEEELNIESLREVYPKAMFGCFIEKPFTIEHLVQRLLEALDR